jgi:16S rRNA (cytosine967-C5)-methyltransferase
MQTAGRLAAAIEVLEDIATCHRPASTALRDWGRAHRFAGSSDRAAIGNIVYDALRHKASLSWAMGSDSARALGLGVLGFIWSENCDHLCDGSKFAPAGLNEDERARLTEYSIADAPDWVQGNYPEWLHQSFVDAFGPELSENTAALCQRAPVDLRVNTLKTTRDKVLKALSKFGAEPTPHSPLGIRIFPRDKDKRSPHVEADVSHGRGWFEIQDEGSQLVSLVAGVEPGMQICDLCAGSGGKTLAFAAAMKNKGQIYAYDNDPHRLRPIFERLKRAGARNVQVLGTEPQALEALKGRMDIVFIDAPCSGTGSWRRKPDAKWRFINNLLQQRINEQREVLTTASALIKPGGRLVYVTCSLLRQENEQQIDWFVENNKEFSVKPVCEGVAQTPEFSTQAPWINGQQYLKLSPATSGTDGFFAAVLHRASN